MNNDKINDVLVRIEKELYQLQCMLNEKALEQKMIECPFEFEFDRGKGQKLGLSYGKNQVVCFDDNISYVVSNLVQCDLFNPKIQKPILKEDFTPRVGYWYFVTDDVEPVFSDKSKYVCFISEYKYFHVTLNENIFIACNTWKYYYPIVVED